jgi:quinol monooxygenase YgiN
VYVAEFTLHVKPGHFTDVAELYSTFVADFLATHDALASVLVVGDEASGIVRGIGVWTDRESADAVNSDPAFAMFNDTIGPLLAAPADRAELSLLHLYSRG